MPAVAQPITADPGFANDNTGTGATLRCSTLPTFAGPFKGANCSLATCTAHANLPKGHISHKLGASPNRPHHEVRSLKLHLQSTEAQLTENKEEAALFVMAAELR
jgi:hypothetical protein